jgi:hypothetical protein
VKGRHLLHIARDIRGRKLPKDFQLHRHQRTAGRLIERGNMTAHGGAVLADWSLYDPSLFLNAPKDLLVPTAIYKICLNLNHENQYCEKFLNILIWAVSVKSRCQHSKVDYLSKPLCKQLILLMNDCGFTRITDFGTSYWTTESAPAKINEYFETVNGSLLYKKILNLYTAANRKHLQAR